jgi:hypothetical protein
MAPLSGNRSSLSTSDSTEAHHAWSEVVEKALTTAETISRQRPRDLDELRIQFEAMWWWIVEDDSILDGSARRWLRRFRRSLQKLVVPANQGQGQ